MGLGIIPHPERIIVEIDPDETKRVTKSGIILPGADHKPIPTEGIVAAVGSKIKEDIKVGDRILFHDNSPSAFKWKDKSYMALREQSVAGVFDAE